MIDYHSDTIYYVPLLVCRQTHVGRRDVRAVHRRKYFIDYDGTCPIRSLCFLYTAFQRQSLKIRRVATPCPIRRLYR